MPTRPVALTIAVLASLALLPTGASAAVKGFTYGVTAAEVTSSSAVLWTRADNPGKITAQVSRTKAFGGKKTILRPDLIARAAHDNVVQTRVAKLAHDTRYYYRFFRKSGTSEIGSFRTAPG